LKLEPAGLAAVGGLFFATCSVVVYLVRQLTGSAISLQDMAVGVSLTFVVSYGGTGLFVWYMLHLAEGELDRARARATTEFEYEFGPDPEMDPSTEIPGAEPHEPAETEEPS
jgi:hypothetical protein